MGADKITYWPLSQVNIDSGQQHNQYWHYHYFRLIWTHQYTGHILAHITWTCHNGMLCFYVDFNANDLFEKKYITVSAIDKNNLGQICFENFHLLHDIVEHW